MRRTMLVVAIALACASTTASAGAPNVIVAVDLANRMQRDAPTDATCLPTSGTPASCTAAVANATSNYYDPYLYTRGTNVAAETTLGVSAGNTTTYYRRKYVKMALSSNGVDKFAVDTISITHDIDANSAYTKFEAATRLSLLKAALYQ